MSRSTEAHSRFKKEIALFFVRDGLFNELSDEEIASNVAGARDVAAIVDNLIQGSMDHGARDNVSVVVAEVAA